MWVEREESLTEISLGDWQAGLFACSPEDEALLGLFWDRYGSSALQPRIPEQFPRHVLVSHLAFLEQGAEPVGLPGQIRLHWDWLREHWLWLIRSLQNHVAATQPSNPFAPKRSTPAQRSAVFSLNAEVSPVSGGFA
jgi:hypothetical protein